MCDIALETRSNTLGGATRGRRLNKVTQQRFHFPLKRSQDLATKIPEFNKNFQAQQNMEITTTYQTFYTKATKMCYNWLLGGLDQLLALTALGMDWTEDDTVKTTVNGISNITFIEL